MQRHRSVAVAFFVNQAVDEHNDRRHQRDGDEEQERARDGKFRTAPFFTAVHLSTAL